MPGHAFAYEDACSEKRQDRGDHDDQRNRSPGTVTACVLIIGNEILSGRTQDANLAFLAQGLNEVGIRLREARVIPDDPGVIVSAVNEVRRAFDYVFTTGGIGPTHDDITARCVADAFGVALIVHPEAKRLLETHYPPGLSTRRGCAWQWFRRARRCCPTRSRARRVSDRQRLCFARGAEHHAGDLQQLKYRLVGGDKVLSRSVSCHLAEGTLAKDLGALQDRYPDVEIGSYPYFRRGDFGVTLVLRGTDRERLAAATDELKALIRNLGGDPQEGLREG